MDRIRDLFNVNISRVLCVTSGFGDGKGGASEPEAS
jgi:hypothetical protein